MLAYNLRDRQRSGMLVTNILACRGDHHWHILGYQYFSPASTDGWLYGL